MTDKVKEVENILYLFSNYWRNDPQNLLEKLTPQQAAHQLNQMLIKARIDEVGRIVEQLDMTNHSKEVNRFIVKFGIDRSLALKAEKDK